MLHQCIDVQNQQVTVRDEVEAAVVQKGKMMKIRAKPNLRHPLKVGKGHTER